MMRRRSSRVGRNPAASPPTREPAENPASAMPARARLPCVSAKAGTAISTAPNPSPSPMQRSAIVRTPIAERAPSRELWCSAAGAAARTGGMRENTNVPTAARIAAPTTGATGSTIASRATSNGPPTKITSCNAASRAYAVLAPSSPATVGQIERSTDETGGNVKPAAAAAAAIAGSGASTAPRIATTPKREGNSTMRRRNTRRAPRRSTWRPPYGAPIATAIP